MNKITKLLLAFVAVTSFSLTSCEPDYVTDGSTVPSEANFTVSYLDKNDNVVTTETYSFDKSNSQVTGHRLSTQDTQGTYTRSSISGTSISGEGQPGETVVLFLDYNEDQSTYSISFKGRNTASFSTGGSNIFNSTQGEVTVYNYDIIPGSTVADMYFRSRSEFYFYASNINNSSQRILVEGEITTNTKF